MIKRLVMVCTVVIMLFGTYGCARTAKNDSKESITVLAKWIRYGAYGNRSGWGEYKYDSTGNMTKATYTSYEPDYSSLWWEYEYDSAGKMTRDTTYYPDDNHGMWTEYSYDSAGNMTKKIDYYSNGGLSHRTKYKYITINPQ